ncbi:MAG: ABC transporter ATP-binding protein/permease [Armatimonadetes bacterium]|nr:ABC transporter ATP-binding protein/permease [Armatimonadota bacterium]MDW8028459.1 ABC transporter ATP-binding protein [Armatimonadota bacterium]
MGSYYVEPLPETLKETINGNEPKLAMSTDMKRNGQFGEQWLVVANGKVQVFELDNGLPKIAGEFRLDQISEVFVEPLIGGGALMVKGTDGSFEELIRYTNTHARKFAQVAKALNSLIKGEEMPPYEEDTNRCPNCGLTLEHGTKVCPICVPKTKTALRLLRYLKPYWWQALMLSLLSILATALGLLPPALNKPLMDIVLAPREPVPIETRYWWLVILVLAFGISRLMIAGLSVVQSWLSAWLGSRLTHDIRCQLFQHLHLLSFRFYDKQQLGNVISRVNQDTQAVQMFLMWGVQDLGLNILQLFGIGLALFAMDWRLAFLVLIPAPLITLVGLGFWRFVRALMHRVWQQWGRLNALLNESLSGLRVVRAFAQEQREISRFAKRSSELIGSVITVERTWAMLFATISLFTAIGTLLVWYVGGRQILFESMTIGTLMAFLFYLGMFYAPLQSLSWLVNWASRSLTAAERLFEILDNQPETDETDAISIRQVDGKVEFKDVVFGYDKHRPVLKGISFTVEPGEMVGLVGHSGAGKTTTINLLCRFYDVDEGQILIDGIDIRKIRRSDLRRQIGIVPQDTFLFSGTIAENITFAKPDAKKEEIIRSAKIANAHDFIVTQKPDGYDTQVGERGQGLSAGERQRIAIARALLPDPKIIILDEATSQVDVETERQIQEAIERLIKGRTTFAIAHRLATLRSANKLIVLKEGQIAEIGNHDELMEKQGEFYRLVQTYQEVVKLKAVQR